MNELAHSWRHVRREFLFALALALFALFIFSIFSNSLPAGFRSAELKFTDASRGGLAIVPASCPSFPDSAGACGSVVVGDGCTIGAGPVTRGGASPGLVLSWTVNGIVAKENSRFSDLFTPYSGAITPGLGSVPRSGSAPINPLVTTTYTFSGTMSLFFITVRNFSCSVTVVVGPSLQPPNDFNEGGTCGAGYYCAGSDLYYRASCNAAGQLVQACAYGCSGGACLGPPPPSGSIRAVPQLIRGGDKVQISWSTANVSACTVSGTNSDSWSGASGSQLSSAITAQTVYTLSCTGLDGSTLNQSTTVNIIPQFQEI